MSRRQLPTQNLLSERIDYNPATGLAVWRPLAVPINATTSAVWFAKYFNTRFAGKSLPTGRKARVGINGEAFLVSRVVWKIETGDDPDCIDHINGNPSDNRFINLRNVTQGANNKNIGRRSDNKSGHAGVIWDAARNLWRAEIMLDGRSRHLGRFVLKEQAIAARNEAKDKLGFTQRHGEEVHF